MSLAHIANFPANRCYIIIVILGVSIEMQLEHYQVNDLFNLTV